ncbi:golgin subfamily A member 4 isoform X1 [Salmo trutta]|uniref:golgin subfamily A member 4 isoform X1 n=1 Tax=Salmo trutta TaxID=8032 RepID=UPI00113180E2|nr:golgin subfamily A member 4-like isoform X1 [Salmo trutta]
MFMKLKQKINEEQSSQRNAQSPQQAQQRGTTGSPRGSINGDGRASPQREESQSLTQKLRVPSVESLLRGASRAEGLFRSPPKEGLNRSPSLNSLTPLGENEALASPSATPPTPAYDPPSDIESEAEESYGSPEVLSALSREQLIHRLHRVEKSLGSYRGKCSEVGVSKCSELVTTYRTVQREKEKSQAILSQSQDKALRRIGELREVDQQTKKHLQEECDAALEEKDQMITVLQTQVALMKKRLKGVPGGAVAPEVEHPLQTEDDSGSAPQRPFTDTAGGSADPSKSIEVLQKRVTHQENLLQKCKELLRTYKDRNTQLTSENDTLQERLQELEKTKGMVIAETKRQMHETLEMKEEEIAQLRSRSKMAVAQAEELQKEKSEKAAFEELEKALAVGQRVEEARRLLQLQLQEQVERAGEEEKRSLQQELTRVKQEVVTIMKKSSEEKMAEMDKLHSEALASKEQELSARINQAVEQCKVELSQAAKDKAQQSALALEDSELQKAAIETESETKANEIRLELETARTRILELESSLEKYSQPGSVPSTDDVSTPMEELRKKHKDEVTVLEEKHCEEMEKHKLELHQEALAQHNAAMEELRAKHRAEVETILKEKEVQLQAHEEDMNQRTMEKLDVKQTQLEALSFELQEVLRIKQVLEERLDAVENAGGSARQESEKRLQEVLTKHSTDIEEIKLQHEQSLGGMKKMLKDELHKLMIVLKEKEKELEAQLVCEKSLKEESKMVLQDRNDKVKELEELRKSLKQTQSEKKGLEKSNAQLSKIRDELSECRTQLKDFVHKLETTQSDFQQKEDSLQQKVQELEVLEKQLQQAKKELSEQDKSYTDELNTKQEEEKRLKKHLEDQKAVHEKKVDNIKKDMEAKWKSQETKMENFKTETKEMQDKFKKKLREQDESLKKQLSKKESVLQQKEQKLKEKILESQTSSEGLSSAMYQLESYHKEELEKMCEVHKQEKEKLENHWQEKMGQQEEEMQDKHTQILQKKIQEVEEVNQQLGTTMEEKEQVVQEVMDLKEELVMRQTTVQKLQAELKEAAVKMESLSQAEAMLKKQMEAVERNLNAALNERNSFQDQLNKTENKAREKLKSLSERFVDTEKQLQALEACKGKEGEAVQRRLEQHSLQLEVKENEMQKQFAGISKVLMRYCRDIEASIEDGTKQLSERVESRVSELKDRVLGNQKKISHLKNVILTKVDRIHTLEKQLVLKTKESEQLTADLKQQHSIREREKRELTERLQQTQEQFRIQNGNLVQATEEKLQSMERENQTLKKELERQREAFDKTKAEILETKDESQKVAEEKLSKDNAGKVAELKKKAEQKISQIRKQLTSQLEEKEKTVKALRAQLEEAKVDEATKKQGVETLEEKGKSLEKAMAKMKEEQEKHIEQIHSDERLEKESSLQSLKEMYEEKLSLLQKDILNQEKALAKCKEEQEKHLEQLRNYERLAKESSKNMYKGKLLSYRRDDSNQEETKADETVSRLEEVEMKLKEVEEEKVNLLAEISHLKEDLLEKTALIEQKNTELPRLETQGQNAVEVVAHCTAEQTKSLTADKERENHSLTQEDGDAESLSSMQNKLTKAVQEKQKLQKYLRTLRKEHQQDLEYVKQELTQENEKKLMLEVEDLEMKHNLSLKQLMREFNTQMALKEQELTAAVKETIEKAQSVEVELMDSHREETNQLQKVIAQKDDDLNRTVQRYEQVLQSREEEMGDRVCQVQKKLEDLQARTHSASGEMGVEELQAQLAEKTTLLSEARLKEQHFVDRIHSLEDKMKLVHKNSVVTHLGTTFKDPGHYSAESFSELTEFEYLRKVLFEYMMGRETKTMAKVITSMLKFPPDQAQQVLEEEDTKAFPWLR